MCYNKIKAALIAAGASFNGDEDVLKVIDILEVQYGITGYELAEAKVGIEEVLKQMSESKAVVILEASYEKYQKRKWYVPKKIGKPQKRKGGSRK